MKLPSVFLALTVMFSPLAHSADLPGRAPHSTNPILPGYYADPSILEFGGKHYIYATLDPWGDETLGCWESSDFKNWTFRTLNWPTKSLCKSPTGGSSSVWAPSVLRGRDGKFYMYVSVHNEVWAGVADTPTGPWKNLLGDKPLIAQTFRPGFHMIDAEGFIDDDGQAYLYWGSGLHWVNGKCWAVKLKPDMVTFDGEVRDVTPKNYFEGPFMTKHAGHYYLMYSHGKTIEETYAVHYAMGDTPFGPFTEASNSPVLRSDKANNILSTGHHAIFTHEGRTYILYHRHSIPFDPKFIGRQVCVDELKFAADGLMENVVPSHDGSAFLQNRLQGRVNLAEKATATASSVKDEFTGAACVLDDNYATRWAPAPDSPENWLQLDLGQVQKITSQEIRFEYAWKSYLCSVETSLDGKSWNPLANYLTTPASGSPVIIDKPVEARFLRLVFPKPNRTQSPALWEWSVF
ncbi:MAG: family 43 glycosylhydrolase [Chthoniobacterales bacterium]